MTQEQYEDEQEQAQERDEEMSFICCTKCDGDGCARCGWTGLKHTTLAKRTEGRKGE